MKGWIKVRELNSYERYIRTSDIEQIAIPDKEEGSYLFTLRGSLVRVRETPGEVLALIEEAEEKEKEKENLWYLKAKEECEKRKGECRSCPFADFCLPPIMWESNPIPEEYR